MAQVGEWIKRGQFVRISPCGKYQIQKATIAGVVAYYVYPVPIGPNLGGPYASAGEAFQCVEEIVCRVVKEPPV